MATKKPARMKNTGMRNAWMKAVSRSATGVVRSSRQGNGESFTMWMTATCSTMPSHIISARRLSSAYRRCPVLAVPVAGMR
jgi:hypothetical protein